VKTRFLGKKTPEISKYSPKILEKVERANIQSMSSFFGCDFWNAYEFSFLNSSNQPVLETLEIIIPMTSLNTVESKSLKLYLASFYNKKFSNIQNALKLIEKDLYKLVKTKVSVTKIKKHPEPPQSLLVNNKKNLIPKNKIIRFEGFRSICPVTNQPDWANIYIHSSDDQIDAKKLNRLLKSYREHGDFHETCIESIFLLLLDDFKLSNVTIFGRFLRRGGIDINPLRSTQSKLLFSNFRDLSQ